MIEVLKSWFSSAILHVWAALIAALTLINTIDLYRRDLGCLGTLWGLILALLVLRWYQADAGSRSYARSALLDGCIALFYYVALPYYLVRSRGWKRGGIAIGKLLASLLAASLIGEAILTGLRHLDL